MTFYKGAGASQSLYLGAKAAAQGGAGLSAGQKATLVRLKAAAVAAQTDNPDVNAEYTPAATVTHTTAATAGLSNEYKYTDNQSKLILSGGVPLRSDGHAQNTDVWAVLGANDAPAGGGLSGMDTTKSTWAMYSMAVEFETDAPDIELRIAAVIAGQTATALFKPRIIVDGKYVSKAGNGVFANTSYFKVAGLPSSVGVFKKVRFESIHGLYSVRVAPGFTVRAPTTTPLVGVLEGDSYTEGQSIRADDGTILVNGHFGWAQTTVRGLGWGRARQVAVGLTGYAQAGGRRTIPTRVPDYIADQPLDFIIVAGGYNDGAGQTTTDGALSTFQQLRSSQQNALIVVMGVWSRGNTTKATFEDAVKAGFDAWGDKFSIFIPVSRAVGGSWPYSVDSDGTHPSNQGHVDLAALAVPAIRTSVLALATQYQA